MAVPCSIDEGIYSGDKSLYNVCDSSGNSYSTNRLFSDSEDVRKQDCILADKLDEIAYTLRCGSPPRDTPAKDCSPRMPLRDVLCAVEKRLKEKVKENPSSFTSKSSQDVSSDPCDDWPSPTKSSGRPSSPNPCAFFTSTPKRTPRRLSFSSCDESWSSSPKRSSSPSPYDDSFLVNFLPGSSRNSSDACNDTWGSEARGSSIYKGTVLRPPPTFEPDPERMAQVYFEDEDQILCVPGEDLKGNVAQILQRRKLAKKCSPGARTPVRQLCTIPVKEEQDDFELLGVTDVASSNYGETCKSRSSSPPKTMTCVKISPPVKVRCYPDATEELEKTMAEIAAQKKREQDEMIDHYARQIVLGSKAMSSAAAKIAQKTPRRWSPERLASMGRRFGIPTSPCRQRQTLRHKVSDRVGLIQPPPEFFEVDEIDDIDVSV